jgi:hypothetical protein
MTLTRATIEVAIPRKREGLGSQLDKARLRFFEQIYDAVRDSSHLSLLLPQ